MKWATRNSISYFLFLLIACACSAGRNSKNAKAIFLGQTGATTNQSGSGTVDSTTNSSLNSTTLTTTTSNVGTGLLNTTWVWTNSSTVDGGINYLILPSLPTPTITTTQVQLIPTDYFDLDLNSNQWVEFNVFEESVLIANATAKFKYSNGGGGSAVIDLHKSDLSGWTNVAAVGHCGSDSVGSATGAGSDEISVATCQERLAPGRYRIRALEGHFSSTTAVSFYAHFRVFRRIVPEQFSGVYSIAGAFPAGTVLFDSSLLENSWKEMILSQKGILYAQALSSFAYQNGGGGTSGIDLQVLQGSNWVPVLPGTDTCSTNSYFQSVSSTTAVEATASCLQNLNAGHYRVRAWESKENVRTNLNYFRASALVLAQ